jgi:hypothetical protein
MDHGRPLSVVEWTCWDYLHIGLSGLFTIAHQSLSDKYGVETVQNARPKKTDQLNSELVAANA